MEQKTYRINQFIAKSLGISRRQADEFIKRKEILVNQEVAESFFRVTDNDKVEMVSNGKKTEIKGKKENQTILFYKPIFCLTTKNDPEKRKTIYHILPKIYHDLKPAGRLDYMSEGLIILSNDGDFLNKLSHPKYSNDKSYLVAINKAILEKEIKEMKDGMVLENYNLNPVIVSKLSKEEFQKYSFLKLDSKQNWYIFNLSEGRNNQIRKMVKLLDKKVVRLIRIKHGEFDLTKNLYEKKVLDI